jgi:hypothetical protein
MSSSILPFSLQLPSGYGFSTGSSGTQGTAASSTSSSAAATSTGATTSANPVDVISLSNNAFVAGDFTAVAGDTYRMNGLFNTSAPAGQTIAGFRVALGGVAPGDGTAGGGKLYLGTLDVSARTSFSADEFAHLTYTTGTGGSQSLVVVAQTGTRLANAADGSLGALTHEIDSPAVQITANVTGSRSINAMSALSTQLQPGDADANIASIAQQAGIFTGFVGTTRAALQTDGNFTAVAGDTFRMSSLFNASAPTGQTIVGFRVALGGATSSDGTPSGGKLFLGTLDVSSRTSFSADEFAHLTYITGKGGPQDLVVVAQTGTRLANAADGSLGALTHEIDSPAVQITANVTGSRSINAMNALSTQLQPGDADADIVSIAQQAGIFTGFGGTTRAALTTDGNFTAVAGDTFRMSSLFNASAPTGQTIVGFRVALGGATSSDGTPSGGKLFLGTLDVSARTSFSADEFSHLTYTTGTGGPQSLVVVAQTGTRLASPPGTLGALTHEIDSPAVQITADVTGSRSINAMNALSTALSGADANIVGVAQQAGIFTGFVGSTRPTLQTAGNFSAVGNVYNVSDLFTASAPTGQAITGYQVTLGDGGGKLQVNGQDVTDPSEITVDDFAHLTYIAGVGADGTQLHQSLTVAALTTPTKQEIGFSAVGDTYRMDELFTAKAPAEQTITGYKVSLGDGGGKLQLSGQDVPAPNSPGPYSFTADQFAQLTYIAGPGADGTQLPQSMTVMAQTASLLTGSTIPQDIGFDADADGQTYPMDSLFTGIAPTGQAIVGFQVTLVDGGGKLQMNGQDVPAPTGSDPYSFTADEFAQLTYIAGPGADGSPLHQSLTVAAQTTPLPTDPITQDIGFGAAGDTYRVGELFTAGAPTGQDIVGYQVSLGVGGGKLQVNGQDVPVPTSPDTYSFTADQFAQLTYIAGAGMNSSQPLSQSLTVKALTAISQNIGFDPAADAYRMDDLFQASAPTGQTIVGYRVALGEGGGSLMNGTVNVTAQTSFTADEFAHLTYVARAGTDASPPSQSLVVVAQTGTLRADGTISQEIDSPAVQITANITGTRSINAMTALSTVPSAADAATVSIVQQAAIFTGFVGSTRPTLQTDGNFTAAAGDTFRMSGLFNASASTGQTIAGFRVALGGVASGGGKLQLNNQDIVPPRTSFSADEFAHLTYVAGSGGPQNLVVIAQTGTRMANAADGNLGALSHEIDSPALQITANVTGSRSINAMNALSTQLTADDADADIASIVQQAGIFTGFVGTTRAALQTDLTPEPPVPLSALEESNGAYQSAGLNMAGPETDLQLFYTGAIGGSVSPGVFASPGGPLATALLLLGGAATGAFQTADSLAAQTQAIKAYNATNGL